MMSAFETVFRKPKTERKDHVGETEMETDILSGIFSIGDMSFDVVLTKSKLTWSPLTSSGELCNNYICIFDQALNIYVIGVDSFYVGRFCRRIC